ncbi:hypothetical protein G6F43_004907 [Rhizopus delemar]|nr:hypothetical protein G6F43_004907 [Rhizopus delemar]
MNQLCSQLDKIQQQILQQTQTADPFPSLNRHPPYQNPEAMAQMTNIETAPWHEPAKMPTVPRGCCTLSSATIRQSRIPQSIYDPTKATVPIGQVGCRLRKLDMHYPDRNILTLLIDNDYAAELRQQLYPQNLRDPKFAHLPLEERIHRAFMHPCDRMERVF